MKDVNFLKKKSLLCQPNESLKISKQLNQFIIKFNKENLIQAIGLAAPQIGILRRIFVLEVKSIFLTFVNPEITPLTQEKSVLAEGCLSLPGVSVKVPRFTEIELAADNFVKPIKLHGLEARAAQHEMDHLNGILITDYDGGTSL